MNGPDPLDVALEIAVEAGKLLKEGLGRRHSMDVNVKRTDTDLVTEFDKRSEALIVEKLRRAFPADEILAEEGGLQGKPATRRWLVDPLDGTTNFAHGCPSSPSPSASRSAAASRSASSRRRRSA
jgi:myo-inositol-1(or 4)-monophosphatase